MLPQMLRCLVFLLSDFSRVGLGRRGEMKKSAVLGVTSRTVRQTTGGGRWGGDESAEVVQARTLQVYLDRRELCHTYLCPQKRLN